MGTDRACNKVTRLRPLVVALGLALIVVMVFVGLAAASSPVPPTGTGDDIPLTRYLTPPSLAPSVYPAPAASSGLATPVAAPRINLAQTLTRTLYLPIIMRDWLPVSRRLGFDLAISPMLTYPEVASLNAGWYADWSTKANPVLLPGMSYVQTIRVHQKLSCDLNNTNSADRLLCPYAIPYDYQFWPDANTIAAIAHNHPGAIWVIGNEIERRDWCNAINPDTGLCTSIGRQDEILPEVYAVAYHDLYQLLKTADPTARVANGGLVQISDLRIEYLTLIWNAYLDIYKVPMPVDVWNIHAFILREVHNDWGAGIPVGLPIDSVGYQDNGENHMNVAYVAQEARKMREWMKERGQQNKDLIVTEYGVLLLHMAYMTNQTNVQNFMLGTFDVFLNTKNCDLGNPNDACRLVQAWSWYSLDDNYYNPYSQLFDPSTHQITATGRAYRDFSRANAYQLSR
jgi:hypothetical protein